MKCKNRIKKNSIPPNSYNLTPNSLHLTNPNHNTKQFPIPSNSRPPTPTPICIPDQISLGKTPRKAPESNPPPIRRRSTMENGNSATRHPAPLAPHGYCSPTCVQHVAGGGGWRLACIEPLARLNNGVQGRANSGTWARK